MELFYSVQFGKHLGRFIAHIFIRSEGNFYEYCLHHTLSLFLISKFSYEQKNSLGTKFHAVRDGPLESLA